MEHGLNRVSSDPRPHWRGRGQNAHTSTGGLTVKKGKFTIEGRVIGLLRSQAAHGICSKSCGTADMSCATVSIAAVDAGPAVLSLPQVPHSVACGENLSLNDHEGPLEGPVVAGK